MLLVDQVIPEIGSNAGGTVQAVLALSEALSDCPDTRVRLITQSTLRQERPRGFRSSVELYSESSSSHISFELALPGRRALLSALSSEKPDLIHSNGIWHPLSHWCSRAARSEKIPMVVQPHGMLEPWALDWKVWRKKLALSLYQQHDLNSAALLVATAEREAENLRRFGLRQPIAVIANGIDPKLAKSKTTRQSPTDPDIFRHALFIGRLHPVKGLENLLQAWAESNTQGWLLQLFGPDESGYLRDLLLLIDNLGLRDRVQYLGGVSDTKKWDAYSNAELFILPSFTENFGIVVAEALSAGLPVITTTGTPWKALESYDCGWWVPPTVGGLRTALKDALSSSPKRLMEMGDRGRSYVQRYKWSDIAPQLLDAYRWLLNRGAKPTFVHLD